MSTYISSDFHGYYNEYMQMLEKIQFSEDDTLYILGDILDRGPHPIKIMLDLMNRNNVIIIAGNHCVMACECFKFLLREITEKSVADIDKDTIEKLLNWHQNGSATTLDEFYKLSKEKQREVVEFIQDFELYEEIQMNGQDFLLLHAGLGNFRPEKEIWEYELDELVWERPDYDVPYYDNKIVITGHTPTLFIDSKANTRPGYIFKTNNHIAIDCGCGIPGGRLGCIRLEDMQEFYVENEK
ncbi:MAG: fructose-bisphosphatase class III [Lachnospiraceae bacterium]